ncbi:MAG: hypothetical protein WD271_16140 [Acidimicrobiia bacterium]
MSHTTRPLARRTGQGACALIAMLLLSALTAANAGVVAVNNGVGTKAALNGPQCDAQRGRIRFVYQGWLPCVKPWPKNANNGGSTYQGVTEDSIKVVIRKAPDQTTNEGRSPIKDRATGQFSNVEAALRDSLPIFEKTYQQWGRKLDVSVVEMSGTDEAANRADAVKIAAMKPFAVIDLVGDEVFLSSIAKQKILALGGMAPNKLSIAQSPYRWPLSLDFAANALLGAELIIKVLAGKPAEHAGDTSLQTKKRVFGTVRSDAATAPDFQPAFDELKKHGVKLAQDLTYAPPLDASQLSTAAQEAAPTLVAKLKDSGVTSVLVLPSDYQMTAALTTAASKNDYHPEWIVMGVGLVDVGALARTFDQDQWKHAFGVSGLWVPVQGQTAGPSDVAFQWYWGPNAGVYSQAVVTDLELLYAGIHMAGPKLTPGNYKAGMFSRPPVGGAAEGQVASAGRFYGKVAKLPYDEYLTGGDVALFWWDPDTAGPSVAVNLPDSKGVYQFLSGGKRFLRGQLSSKAPAFFDKSKSINVLTTLPAADVPPDYPCNGCPSSGGATS